jgi:hypothetical protein
MQDDQFLRDHVTPLGCAMVAVQVLMDAMVTYATPDDLEAAKVAAMGAVDRYIEMQRAELQPA